jgi:hypothetical protein
MGMIFEIHLVIAFLLLLCAVVFSWNAMGRRVVNVVAGLQVLVGLAAAATLGMQHLAMPPLLWLHILIALAILAAYGFAMRAGKRAGGGSSALALSVLGLLLVCANIYLGWHMAGRV